MRKLILTPFDNNDTTGLERTKVAPPSARSENESQNQIGSISIHLPFYPCKPAGQYARPIPANIDRHEFYHERILR